MITDALVSFVPVGSPLSLIGALSTTFRSNIIDLLGQGVGTAPSNIIGTRTVFGTDMGVGGKRPELNVTIGIQPVVVAASTLKISLQAAIDQGSAGGYQPGTWIEIDGQSGLAAADLTVGAVPFRSPWMPTFPAGLMPRYLSLLFSISALGAFTAGQIASALVTMVRDDQANKFAAKNFTVA